MTTNYVQLIIESALRGIAIAFHALGQAALANPWVVVVLGAVIVLGTIGRTAGRAASSLRSRDLTDRCVCGDAS